MALKVRGQPGATHLWAVGMKGWVEIRSAPSPPRKKVSETIKKIQYRDTRPVFYPRAQDGWGEYRSSNKLVRRDLKLTVTTFSGGRVCATLKADTFARHTKVRVGSGGLIELTPDMITVLTEKGVLK